MESEHYDIQELMKPLTAALNNPKNFLSPHSDDTNAVITSTELINDLLQLAIMHRFVGVHRDKEFIARSDVSEAFNWRGPLGTMYARTVVCSSLNLIKANTRKDLDTVRDIRNAFCHTREPRSFSDPGIMELCAKLLPHEGLKVGDAKIGMDQMLVALTRLGMKPEGRVRYTISVLVLVAALAQTIFISFRQIQFMEKHKEDMFDKPKEEFPALAQKFVADVFVRLLQKFAEDIRARSAQSSDAQAQTPEAAATSSEPAQE